MVLFSDVLYFYKDIFIHNYFEKPFVESNKVGYYYYYHYYYYYYYYYY